MKSAKTKPASDGAITNRDIVTANSVMPMFMQVGVPADQLTAVLIAQDRVSRAFMTYEKARVRLVEEHGQRDSGKELVTRDVVIPEIKQDGEVVRAESTRRDVVMRDQAAFNNDLVALQDAKADFDAPEKIDLKDLKGATYPPAVIMAIKFLFKGF